jgi:ABC-type Mn2+/Zn2+ transport system permease subunit
MLFYGIAGAVITFATHLVGDIFVFGFLVIPPVAAMLLTQRVRRIFLFSAIIGALSPIIGLFFAFKLDLPASPTAVAVSTIVLLASWIFHSIYER